MSKRIEEQRLYKDDNETWHPLKDIIRKFQATAMSATNSVPPSPAISEITNPSVISNSTGNNGNKSDEIMALITSIHSVGVPKKTLKALLTNFRDEIKAKTFVQGGKRYVRTDSINNNNTNNSKDNKYNFRESPPFLNQLPTPGNETVKEWGGKKWYPCRECNRWSTSHGIGHPTKQHQPKNLNKKRPSQTNQNDRNIKPRATVAAVPMTLGNLKSYLFQTKSGAGDYTTPAQE